MQINNWTICFKVTMRRGCHLINQAHTLSVNLLPPELKKLLRRGNQSNQKLKIEDGIGAQILHDIDISKIRLVSNTEQEKTCRCSTA
jgi:hypothetical protein